MAAKITLEMDFTEDMTAGYKLTITDGSSPISLFLDEDELEELGEAIETMSSEDEERVVVEVKNSGA